MLDPRTSTATSPALRGLPRRARPARVLGSRPAAPPRGRASRDRPRRVAWRAGVRVRLRRPDRRRVVAARTRSPAAPTSRCRCPYEPGRVAFASLSRTATDLAGLADGRVEELPPRSAEYQHPALAHLERALFEESPPPAPDLDAAVRFLEGAGTRGTLELVADELTHLIRQGVAPERIALVAPSLETLARAARDGARRRSTSRTRSSRARDSARRRSATRSCSSCATRGPMRAAASCSPTCAPRTRGSRARPSTTSKGGCAVARSTRPRGSRRRPRSCARRRFRASPNCARPTIRSRPSASYCARCCASAYGTEAPPAGETSRLDLRAYGHALELLDELDGWAESPRRAARRARALRGAAGVVRRSRPRRRPRPAARAHAPLRRRLRARPRRRLAAAALPHLAVPRRRPAARARRSARAARPGEPRPLPLLHGVHARHPASLPRARSGDRRRPAASSRARSGKRSRRSSTPRTSSTRRRAARCRRSRGRSKERPSERERLRSLAQLGAADPDAARALADANDWQRRLRRAQQAQPSRDAAAQRGASRRSTARARRSASPSSSGSPTAPRRGSSSA